jgi:hypothetical protein
MKNIIYCGIGAGLGSTVYQMAAHGLSETDWYRSIFFGLFAMLFFGLFVVCKRRVSKEKDA